MKRLRNKAVKRAASACREVVLVATIVMSCFSTAVASDYAGMELKHFAFNLKEGNNPPVRVTSSDGKKWDTIQPGTGRFWGEMIVDTKWPGFVEGVNVVLGDCVSILCYGEHSSPVDLREETLFGKSLWQRDYKSSRNFQFSYLKLMKAPANNSYTQTYGSIILGRCNEALSKDGPTKKHSFLQEIRATLTAEGGEKYGALGEQIHQVGTAVFQPQHEKAGAFWIKVDCDPVYKPATTNLATDLGSLKAKELKVFLTTSSNAVTHPSPGVECKKARVNMRVRTNRAGTVLVKLTIRKGTEPFKSEFFKAESKFKEAGVYEANLKKWISVSKTSVIKAMLATYPDDYKSTYWNSLTLHCNGVGGGGFASPEKPDNEVIKRPLKVMGELTFLDNSHKPKNEPRPVSVLLKLTANKGSYAKYKLTCSKGRKWEGKLTPVKQGPMK
ncbi:MAG: hypothetical protein ABJN51_18530, partial [Sneathiella sp.]